MRIVWHILSVGLFFYISSFGLSQERVIGHISSAAGGFSPGMIIANMNPVSAKSFTLRPFTIHGEALPLVEGTIAAGSTDYKSPLELFGQDVSHIVIEGDADVSVSTTYQALTPESTPVHVTEHNQQAPHWRVYPGNWAVTWDGLAIVNTSLEPAQVLIHQIDDEGHILNSQASFTIAPFAKYLGVLGDTFDPVSRSHFEIIATQPIAVTALRGSKDGRFLWVNSPLAQPENPTVFAQSQFTVSRTSDVKYGEGLTHSRWSSDTATSMDLFLDVYEPVGATGSRPVLVFIHGGAFFFGSKSSPAAVDIMNYFASRGFVCFSISYRLAGDKGTVPKRYYDVLSGMRLPNRTLDQTLAMYTAGRDAKAAIRWIRSRSNAYNLDTRRISVAGGSAGAVTAIALGVSNPGDFRDELNLNEDPTLATTHLEQDDSIHAVIDFWGSGVMTDILTDVYDTENRWDETDRPLAIIHGTDDRIVAYDKALELASIYQQTGAYYELHPLEGQGHSAWDARIQGKSIYQVAFDFVVSRQRLLVIP